MVMHELQVAERCRAHTEAAKAQVLQILPDGSRRGTPNAQGIFEQTGPHQLWGMAAREAAEANATLLEQAKVQQQQLAGSTTAVQYQVGAAAPARETAEQLRANDQAAFAAYGGLKAQTPYSPEADTSRRQWADVAVEEAAADEEEDEDDDDEQDAASVRQSGTSEPASPDRAAGSSDSQLPSHEAMLERARQGKQW